MFDQNRNFVEIDVQWDSDLLRRKVTTGFECGHGCHGKNYHVHSVERKRCVSVCDQLLGESDFDLPGVVEPLLGIAIGSNWPGSMFSKGGFVVRSFLSSAERPSGWS